MSEDIYEKIVTLRSKGIRAVLATIIARKGATPRKDAAKMLIDEAGAQFGTIGGGSAETEVVQEAGKVLLSGCPKLLSFDLTGDDPEENVLVCGGHMEVYLEPITSDPTLYIFGAGHVGKALSHIARFAGFRIVVVDDREKFANRERFPDADDFYIDSWDNLLDKAQISDNSYIFISTRDHQYDERCLCFSLRSPARYIGMLGSQKKIRLLKEFLEKEGMDPNEFLKVSVPGGLDIGAETPEEIAVSVVSELIAARKNRNVISIKNAVHNADSC